MVRRPRFLASQFAASDRAVKGGATGACDFAGFCNSKSKFFHRYLQMTGLRPVVTALFAVISIYIGAGAVFPMVEIAEVIYRILPMVDVSCLH